MCSARASSLGRSALVPRDTDAFILVFTTPVKHTKSTPRARVLRRVAPVVPSERQWVTQRPRFDEERALRTVGVAPVTCRSQQTRATVPWVAPQLMAHAQPVQLFATDPCHSAMGGAAAHGPCAACAALARLWRRTSATRDRPARQPRTASHRSADASRSVPIAGGEIELALLRATARSRAGFGQGVARVDPPWLSLTFFVSRVSPETRVENLDI